MFWRFSILITLKTINIYFVIQKNKTVNHNLKTKIADKKTRLFFNFTHNLFKKGIRNSVYILEK
jgi:hypothetical protein